MNSVFFYIHIKFYFYFSIMDIFLRCLNDLDGLDPEELTLLHHKDQLQSAIREHVRT